MADELKIDLEAMKTKVQDMQEVAKELSNFSDKPFKDELSWLENMNTDFLAEFDDLLKDLNDDNLDVVKTMEDIASKAKNVQEEFENLDDTWAKGISSPEASEE